MKGRIAPSRPPVPRLGIGLLGYGFMGRAHSNAYRTMPYIFWPPVVEPDLIAICGRTEERVAEAAARYGFAEYYTDWRDLIADDRIQVLDNCGSNGLHVEPSIAALEAGKHVLCEKPMALDAASARRMRDAALRSSAKHMAGFNYRFLPAVRLARDVLNRGLLGRIYHFRARYLQESAHAPGVPWGPSIGPAGALLVIGTHLLDMARFLIGEIATVQAEMTTFNKQRPHPTQPETIVNVIVDESFETLIGFSNGARGTVEASFASTGRKNQHIWEITGDRGSMWFDLEDLNRLHVYLADDRRDELAGFRDVIVTETPDPYRQVWWPRGHTLGWEHAHINEIAHFLRSIACDTPVDPDGATFEDGYRVAVVCEAIQQSAQTGRRITVTY